MHDAFLLLTPVLTLAVVALAGFIGCDVILGLERDPNPPRNLMAVPGNNRIDLSWDPPKAGMVGKYVVHIGTSSGMYSSTHETEDSDPEYSDTDAINGSTYFYAVSAKGSAEMSNEVEMIAGFTGLTSMIQSKTLGSLRNDFGGLVGLGVTVGSTPLLVKTIGRFKAPGNSGIHAMKLVDATTKADIAGGGVTIDLASGTQGEFLYAPLANPVMLDAGADYYLVSEEFNAGDQWYDADTTVAVTAVASRVYAVNGDGAGSYNVAPINGHAYGPVDLQH